MKAEKDNICISSSYATANTIRMKLLLFIDKELLSNDKIVFPKLKTFQKNIEFTESFSHRTKEIFSFSKKSTIDNSPLAKKFRNTTHKKSVPQIKSNTNNLNLVRDSKKYGTFTDKIKNLNDMIFLNGKIYSISKFSKRCSCIPIHNKTKKDNNYLKKLCDDLKMFNKKKERKESSDIGNYNNYTKPFLKRATKKKNGFGTCKNKDNSKNLNKYPFSLKNLKKNKNSESNINLLPVKNLK